MIANPATLWGTVELAYTPTFCRPCAVERPAWASMTTLDENAMSEKVNNRSPPVYVEGVVKVMSGPKGFGPAPPMKLFAGNVIGPLRARTVPGPWLLAVVVASEPGGNADGPIEMSKFVDETADVTVDCPGARRKL